MGAFGNESNHVSSICHWIETIGFIHWSHKEYQTLETQNVYTHIYNGYFNLNLGHTIQNTKKTNTK